MDGWMDGWGGGFIDAIFAYSLGPGTVRGIGGEDGFAGLVEKTGSRDWWIRRVRGIGGEDDHYDTPLRLLLPPDRTPLRLLLPPDRTPLRTAPLRDAGDAVAHGQDVRRQDLQACQPRHRPRDAGGESGRVLLMWGQLVVGVLWARFVLWGPPAGWEEGGGGEFNRGSEEGVCGRCWVGGGLGFMV